MRPISESPVRDAQYVILGLRHQLRDQYGETPSNSLSSTYFSTYFSLPADLNDFDFDEVLYLELYPDVAECVRTGKFRSGFEHWLIHGKGEGRKRRFVLLDSLQRIADATSAANKLVHGIGQAPPAPPTARGRIGSILALAIQRALSWYTSSLQSHASANQRILSEQSRLLAALCSAIRCQREDIQTLRLAVRELQNAANISLDQSIETASDDPTQDESTGFE